MAKSVCCTNLKTRVQLSSTHVAKAGCGCEGFYNLCFYNLWRQVGSEYSLATQPTWKASIRFSKRTYLKGVITWIQQDLLLPPVSHEHIWAYASLHARTQTNEYTTHSHKQKVFNDIITEKHKWLELNCNKN